MNAVDLALVRDLVARARIANEQPDDVARIRNHRCVYCGHRHRSAQSVACPLHRDLPALDPKYAVELGLLLPVAGNRSERTPGSRIDITDDPFRTFHGTSDRALVVPLRNHANAAPVGQEVLPTVTAEGNHHGLVVAKGEGSVPHPIDEPLPAVTTIPQLRLLTQAGGPSGTARRERDPDMEPMPTMIGENHTALVVRNNGSTSDSGWETTPTEEPLRTVTTKSTASVVMPYYSNGEAKPVDEPIGAVTTRDRFAIVDLDEFIADCTFRMLQPHEIATAMQMHVHANGEPYVVLGNKREKVAQYGNAVTPPVMRMLVERVVEALEPVGIGRAA